MVLRCSLLGHDYGDEVVEHEREERGSEVVVTVQTYEKCNRCNKKHIISENTEVTSLATRTDADPHPDEPETEQEPPGTTDAALIDAEANEGSTGSDADTAAAADTDPVSTDTTPAASTASHSLGDGADEGDGTAIDETVEADESAVGDADDDTASDDAGGFDVPTDENGEPITDDGEILTDESENEPDTRGHGEWPDSDDVGQPISADATPTDWPDDGPTPTDRSGDDDATAIQPDDEGAELIDDDTARADDDAVVLEPGTDSDSETTATGSVGIDADPPSPESIDANTDSETDDSIAESTGIKRAGAAPTPTDGVGPAGGSSRSELSCPSCGYVAGPDRSSLRTGDICPECGKGYLSERRE